MRSNSLSWSPTFPTTVLLASEDHNLYTFDIRSLNTPTQIYKAHVAAVMSCDWSPTGLEFVSGGWDRTVRIWKEGRGSAPEVYHTKRMQRCATFLSFSCHIPTRTDLLLRLHRVMSTVYTGDARFVLSGSDDGNVRIWKAHASDKLGIITARERAAIEYRETLKARWKADAEVSKISRCVTLTRTSPLAHMYLCADWYVTGYDTCQSRCTRPRSSSGRCSRRSASKRSGGASIRGRARTSQRRSGRRSSSQSSLSSSCPISVFQRVFVWFVLGLFDDTASLLLRQHLVA